MTDQPAPERQHQQPVQVEDREARTRRTHHLEAGVAEECGELLRTEVPTVPDVAVVRGHGSPGNRDDEPAPGPHEPSGVTEKSSGLIDVL